MTLIEYFHLELDGLCQDNHTIYYFTHDMISRTGYQSHIVSCQFNNPKHLERYWNEVVNLVAMKIQATVPNRIEAYNIYIIFFCDDIDEWLQFKIEQNKYSSRKIIIKSHMPDELGEIMQLLEARLFSLSIPEDTSRSTNVDLHLREKGENAYTLVSNVKRRVQDITDSQINCILVEFGIEEWQDG